MRSVAIIQARMGSSRLPGKVLCDLAGRSMLERVVRRTRRAARLDAVVVATSTNAADDPIADECRRLDVPVTRGDAEDCLDRYRQAADEHAAAVIVRITADCPFVDPRLIDLVLDRFQQTQADYACVVPGWTYPRGLDTEAIARPALELAWQLARTRPEREHVTPFLHQHPDLFRLTLVGDKAQRTELRWTVDTPDDLRLAQALYACFDSDDRFSWRDVLALIDREPALAQLNCHVPQQRLAG